MTEPEADKWICVKCGYTCNSDRLKEKHEAGEWMVLGGDTLNHRMEKHPERD